MSERAPAVDEVEFSQFLIRVPLRDQWYRFFSTFWYSCVDLDEEHIRLVERGSPTSKQEEHELSSLVDVGILVSKNQDEVELFRTDLKRLRYSRDHLFVTVLTTARCNFRCLYCIQEGTLDKTSTMTPALAGAVEDWIFRLMDNFQPRQVTLFLYGGEPLTNYQVVRQLMSGIRKRADQLELAIEFKLFTNGSLLTEERIGEMRGYGLSHVHVTVDGLADTHNRRRYSGSDTFEIIWANVLSLASHNVDTTVSSVVDDTNVGELPELVDLMVQLGDKVSDLGEFLRVNYSFLARSRVNSNLCEGMGPHRREVNLGIAKAYAYAKAQGLRIAEPWNPPICGRETLLSFDIDPLGNLYKCIASVGDPRYSIGHISQRIEDVEDRARSFATLSPWECEECRGCNILPLCRGGCQFQGSLLHDGEYGHRFCEKNQLIDFYSACLRMNVL